jgi:phosphoenolpyruvate carboxykinase (ATP)
MSVSTIAISIDQLTRLGFRQNHTLHYQLTPEELVQDVLRLNEGVLNDPKKDR